MKTHCPQAAACRGPARAGAAHAVLCPQGQQAHHAAARVPGQRQLPHHHDRAHLGRRLQLCRDPVHHPDRLPSPEDEEEENKGRELSWRGVVRGAGAAQETSSAVSPVHLGQEHLSLPGPTVGAFWGHPAQTPDREARPHGRDGRTHTQRLPRAWTKTVSLSGWPQRTAHPSLRRPSSCMSRRPFQAVGICSVRSATRGCWLVLRVQYTPLGPPGEAETHPASLCEEVADGGGSDPGPAGDMGLSPPVRSFS